MKGPFLTLGVRKGPFATVPVMKGPFITRGPPGKPSPVSSGRTTHTVRTVAIIAMSSCSRLWQCMTKRPV